MTPAAPTIAALQRTVGNAVVQRMLRRNNFSTATRTAMPVAQGQHRRHIVPHHAMKGALQNWWDSKGSQTAGNNTQLNSLRDVQGLLDSMNNNTSNLWPGQGAANSAIGMLAHHMPDLIDEISRQHLAGQEAYDVIAQYSGFQQNTQQQLADPIFEFVRNQANPREVVRFLKQVQLNAEIDMPSGNPQASVMAWQDLRGRFERLQNDPVRHTEAHVLSLYQDFMNMPAPV
ncbi:hypothetical protein [Streptomyces sp. TS71-3]|uniref:hypothetical protein n=1 Tax=Streptomyces sp. TS71-3 TaxID=2733862 RepID=UPI001B254C55|nr:hypothetical protein [Streptomyces sp. TS71-3]GHJ41105.1 hypothetical protein Sm713_67140 [Streptomyces sp. TS71-3]